MKNEMARKSSGTRSFWDLLRSPGWLLGTDIPDPETGTAHLKSGEPLEIAAFLRQTGHFRQGRILLRPTHENPVVWARYRLLGSYKEEAILRRPYVFRRRSAVAGPGAWNIDRARFEMLEIEADGENFWLVVPIPDVGVLRECMTWIGQRP